jgi:tRNA (mo5U34)-methyltransferase
VRTDDELRREIEAITWFHSIKLRPGITTPGHSNESFTLSLLNLPEDLTGKTVLDIGCWDGFYSFECERRGAKRVVATDVWESAGRAGFDLAREELGSSVEPVEASIYDLPEVLGGERFDLVLFLGVLYHLRHPLLGIEKAAACTQPGGLCFVDTVVDVGVLTADRPMMTFYPGHEVNHDATTWWAPNIFALQEMMKVSGFAHAYSVVQLFAGNRTVVHAVKASDEECAELARQDYDNRHLQGGTKWLP